MKKSYLIITAAALLAAASCQKGDNAPASGVKYNPVEVVLSAAIEGVDTKVSYTEDANALKSAWVKDDAISLIAYDLDGKVLSNDIFTATTAGTTTKFSGTYSNPDGAVAVSVFYPALTEGNGSDATPWQSKTKMAGTSPLTGVLFNMVKDKEYISVRNHYQLQRGNADLSNVKEAAVMQGVVTGTDIAALKAGEAKVTLKNICYVIKISAKVPSSVGTVKSVIFQAEKADGSNVSFCFSGWTKVNSFGTYYGNPWDSIGLGLGSDFDGASSDGTGISPDSSGYITAYLVGYTGRDQTLPAGATLKVSFSSALSKSSTPLASDLTLEPGKMYRINVDMTK